MTAILGSLSCFREILNPIKLKKLVALHENYTCNIESHTITAHFPREIL